MRKPIAVLILALSSRAAPAFADDVGNNAVCFVPRLDGCALVAVTEIGKAVKTVNSSSCPTPVSRDKMIGEQVAKVVLRSILHRNEWTRLTLRPHNRK